jgi:hypothetical protein
VPKQRVHHNPHLDPLDPTTWPALLRERDICKDPSRQYPGLLPVTSSGWRDRVTSGVVKPPLVFGRRLHCWQREYILYLQQNGIPQLVTTAAEG